MDVQEGQYIIYDACDSFVPDIAVPYTQRLQKLVRTVLHARARAENCRHKSPASPLSQQPVLVVNHQLLNGNLLTIA